MMDTAQLWKENGVQPEEKKKNHIYSSQTWSFYLMTITCCPSNRISFPGLQTPAPLPL